MAASYLSDAYLLMVSGVGEVLGKSGDRPFGRVR